MKTKSLFVIAGLVVLMTGVQAQQAAKVSAQDYADIKQLYALSGQTLDTGADNGNAYARLFTADAVVTAPDGRTIKGRDALAAFARGDGKTPTSMGEFIYNVRLDQGANGAINGMVYVIMASLNQGQPATVSNGGQYHDELVKTAEGWRIKSRKFVRANANAPAQPPPAARPGQ